MGILHFDVMIKAPMLAVAEQFSLAGLLDDIPAIEASRIASNQCVAAIRFNAFLGLFC